MSHSPKSAIVHENIANGGTELEKKLLNLKSPFNDIDDVYLSSNFNELDRSSHVSVVMSERVQSIASGIYKEFETMIEAYGLPVVERLMPLIISLLENLDELYKDQSAYHAEVRQLREENEHIYDQLTAEKAARKQSELRLLNAEDAFDEERKVNEAKNESLSTSCRQTELRLQLAKDQVSRLEVKEQEWKKEENRLHEHLNELIRSNVELTEQIKFINNNNQDQSRNTLNNHIHKHSPRKLSMNSPKYNLTGSTNHDQSSTIDGSSIVHSNSLGVGYDATSGGFEFDELPNTLESESGGLNVDDDLPAGMRKEIDVLIKENMELVEMKNALNVVKDDLLARIDHLTSENISLHESVNMLTDSRIRLQSELTNIDQMLNDARTEINQLNEKLSFYQDKTNIESTNSAQVKRFTRSEMARILAERNHYKERLLELQDAVRFTETLRVSQKGHRELFMTKTPTIQQCKFDLNSPVSGPLQSLQKFYKKLLQKRLPLKTTTSLDL
uniref:Homeobox protein six-related n=1 Tax=Schistosoma mansoni TaxID=6183 RepID=A0A5K4EYT3_SCHMA